MMRRWAEMATALGGTWLMLLALSTPAAAAAPCDEYNPAGPWRGTQIRLSTSDFLDEERDEMRTFVATDSVGAVTAALVAASPRGAVRAVSAVPEVSRYSPYYGEELKGVAITVLLEPRARPASVTVNVRQVCARYFRNTFLYY